MGKIEQRIREHLEKQYTIILEGTKLDQKKIINFQIKSTKIIIKIYFAICSIFIFTYYLPTIRNMKTDTIIILLLTLIYLKKTS